MLVVTNITGLYLSLMQHLQQQPCQLLFAHPCVRRSSGSVSTLLHTHGHVRPLRLPHYVKRLLRSTGISLGKPHTVTVHPCVYLCQLLTSASVTAESLQIYKWDHVLVSEDPRPVSQVTLISRGSSVLSKSLNTLALEKDITTGSTIVKRENVSNDDYSILILAFYC